MSRKRQTKLVSAGEYAAEVEVELIEESAEGWGPYLSVQDARKLDEVRAALRRGDLRQASRLARVYHLTPVAA